MTLEFLTVAHGPDAPLASSPFEHDTSEAGAHFQPRDGWNVAAAYASAEEDAQVCRDTVGWVDVSHLGKIEIQAAADDLAAMISAASGAATMELASATRAGDSWFLPLSPTRALVVCPSGRLAELLDALEQAAASTGAPATVTDVTSVFGALILAGPRVRDVFARFCAIDLRASVTPVLGLRPGSVARQPGILVREATDRFLYLFGAAVSHYVWTVVDDAARPFGGAPAGVDALALIEGPPGA
jgi:heterotetrameric sarcosine oxidase gamma subunit